MGILRQWVSRILLPVGLTMTWPVIASARDVVSLFDAAIADSIPSESVAYKTVGERDLALHLFDPAHGAPPRDAAILWYHGGGWTGGEPYFMFRQAKYFALLGFTCAVAEYRLAGEDGATIFDCVADARDAFYWVHSNAAELGIDPGKIVVAGESAGGHLAACVGTIPDGRGAGIPVPQPWPAGCVLVNPIVDLTTISWAMTKPGLTPEDVALAESISPLYFAGPDSSPALLLHGAADSVVPPQQSVDYAEALHAEGVPANLRLWPEKEHAFFLYLPEIFPNLNDKPVIQLSLLEIEAFLQAEGLNGYPVVHGHFSPVHLFAGDDGWSSFSELFELDGLLCGSTYKGGVNDAGTLFSMDPATRAFRLLHSFDFTDGNEPFNGMTTDGTRLYGACKFGGDFGEGTLFNINRDGTGFQVLHHFGENDQSGFYPHAGPVLVEGTLYGTTYHGGSTVWGGTLYRYPLPSGPFEVIHSFTEATGRHPTGQLTPVGDWLYGTTSDFFEEAGGNFGTLFRYSLTSGQFELLHAFDGSSEGGHPYDALLYDGVDTLYGTTFGQPGNPLSMGTLFAYSISADTLTVLHDFGSNPGTGSKPNSSLITIDSSGFLYGHSHGSNDPAGETGTLFRIRTDGSEFTLLHRFTGGLAGNTPMRGLAYANGAFYGVTAFGGLTTNVDDPETGGGFIFRYAPVEPATAARSAYVGWMAGHGLLVNQSFANNADADGWSLIEEFAFDGSPFSADSHPVTELSLQDPHSLRLRIPRIRSVITPGLGLQGSHTLAEWVPAAGFSLQTRDLEPGFEEQVYDFASGPPEESALFLRLNIGLGD
ncbi:MAG: choice-of-anchor tandem repeat GloVer-containing protein [Oceanipulchritudo sp.]